jgi:hypothetical protein
MIFLMVCTPLFTCGGDYTQFELKILTVTPRELRGFRLDSCRPTTISCRHHNKALLWYGKRAFPRPLTQTTLDMRDEIIIVIESSGRIWEHPATPIMVIMSMGWDYVSELRPSTSLLFISHGGAWCNDDVDRGKLLIHLPSSLTILSADHLVGKEEELVKEMNSLRNICFIFRKAL